MLNHNRDKVDQLYRRHLVLVDLGILNLDKLVTDILSHIQHAVVLEYMRNHSVILCHQKLKQVLSRQIEVGIQRHRYL